MDIVQYTIQNLEDTHEIEDIYPLQYERIYTLGDTIKGCK